MIYEVNIEGMDFVELIITQEEYEYLANKGVVQEYVGEERNINVFIRKEECKKINT